MISRLVTGAILGLALTTAASAQSYNAPAGIPAVTAPGGVNGLAGEANLHRNAERHGRPAVLWNEGVSVTGSTVRAPSYAYGH